MRREFKTLLKALRLRAGYGLRQFAELIDESPPNYANVESGKRAPWRSREKLRRIADALAIEEGSADWDAFFIAASDNTALPPDVGHMLERPQIPVLLRTIDELRLTDDDLRKLVSQLRKNSEKKKRAT